MTWAACCELFCKLARERLLSWVFLSEHWVAGDEQTYLCITEKWCTCATESSIRQGQGSGSLLLYSWHTQAVSPLHHGKRKGSGTHASQWCVMHLPGYKPCPAQELDASRPSGSHVQLSHLFDEDKAVGLCFWTAGTFKLSLYCISASGRVGDACLTVVCHAPSWL